MNILLLCDEYPPGRHGGIGTATQLLGRALVKKGHTVVVAGYYHWGYGGEDVFDDEGVKIYRFRRGLSSPYFDKADSLRVRITYRLLHVAGMLQRDVKYSLKKYEVFLQKLIKEYDIHIVEMPDYNDYMHMCKTFVPFPKLSAPTIVKLHGSMTYINGERNKPTPLHIKQMEGDVLNKADAVVSVSRYTADKSAIYFNYHRKITVLHNGIQIPEEIQVNKIKNLVVYTGSLLHLKGIYQLMKAWNIVVRQIPDSRLKVYGKGPVKNLVALLDRQNKNTVSFEGHVERKKLFEFLASAEVAVFPSYTESFALGPMEAMVQGTAVIYTRRASGRELIQEGENGLLVDPDDVEGIAKSIVDILKDKQLRERIAANGQKTIREWFSIEKIADNHIKFYEEVISKYRNVTGEII
jgi:glycosyltransferase involved in cell wall biosynthesis